MTCSDRENYELITVTAEELIAEFDLDAAAAIEKYTKKKVHITTGEIVERGFPIDNIPSRNASYVIFGKVNQQGRPTFSENTVIISFFDKVIVHSLKDGYILTTECYFKEYNINNEYGNSIVFIKGKIMDIDSNGILSVEEEMVLEQEIQDLQD
jgi:hypothetical protein